ncbi:MAG: TonB-dependent receptor [Porticoccaceae bacterium]|jgi:iron complex outermembrane recepter protein|nr:TonB-dependent receptor [Alphaproteobacteria bacterium]MDP4743944.1 TonB-dependent receptor [Porticoccaceae bacterium]MDP4752509.1 TonB-dependent receptor [Porticoccaceae bacterium]MDP4889809.1 TonB-dependent receptor [Porticoccaceae bacterium]
MKKATIWKLNTIAAAIISGATMIPVMAVAQDGMVEEIVTTGSRAKARSATDTVAAVDVITSAELTNQGDMDVANLLRNSVPSFSVNDQPISDAATLVRPFQLRGMAPDHSLILVNNKRRHRASVIVWSAGGISDGSHGADVSTIPGMALKSVEVLRDGAAALYGSDALAGVINFKLKDASEGGSAEIRMGEYTEGDGKMAYFAGNMGMELGANGFANVTLEYGSSDETVRSVQRNDAAELIAAGYPVADPAQKWGRPFVDNDLKLFVNFGSQLTDSVELYGYGNYATKDVDGGFYFRNPLTRGGVYASGGNLLVGDTTGDMSGNCGQYAVSTADPSSAALADAIAGLKADDNCFNFNETIPGGFTPRFGGTVTDITFMMGLKGALDNGLTWDISAYRGENEGDFYINNTVNASLGANSPRNFDPGLYRQTDTNFNVDFTYAVSEAVNVAFGAEHRKEEFTIGAGQTESYIDGGLGVQGFSTSTNGFPGFSPDIAGTFGRANDAIYVDAEWDASEDLLLAAAVRFEDFDGFGSTTNYKLGANYKMTENMGVRATLSTGFKAPTSGQLNASNISTLIDNGVLVNKGVIPASNPVAAFAGAVDLQPEESNNFTVGLFGNLGEFDVTLDYFNIEVTDRLTLSKDFSLSAADIAALTASGVSGANDIAVFRFFTNDFETETSGFDLVVSTETEWLGGSTSWNLAYNNTKTEVTSRGQYIDDVREKSIEEMSPDTRYNLSANHMMDGWRMLARLSYYGDWYDSNQDLNYSGVNVVDVEVSYDLNENSAIMIGGNNIFDEAGSTKHNGAAGAGNKYSEFAPMGFSGAFWYAKYSYNF